MIKAAERAFLKATVGHKKIEAFKAIQEYKPKTHEYLSEQKMKKPKNKTLKVRRINTVELESIKEENELDINSSNENIPTQDDVLFFKEYNTPKKGMKS